MDVIEELKRDVQHELDCDWWLTAQVPGSVNGCACSYRRKLAFLDRLREPTQHMKDEGHYSRDCPVSGSEDLGDIFVAMLAAAQEGL